MKSPSFFEFQTIIQYLQEEIVGAQLQEVYSTNDGVVLGLYRFVKEPKTVWLVLDLDVQFPFVGLYAQNPWPKIKKVKPVALFLNSHFKNTYLKSIDLQESYGRVAELDFSLPDKKLVLQLQLIPRQPNMIVTAGDKTISWDRPRDLTPVNHEEDYQAETRSIPFLFKQWFERRAKIKAETGRSDQAIVSGSSPYDKWVQQRKKDVHKKQKAIEQIDQQNKDLLKVPWSQIGDYLKTHGYRNLPLEWSPFVDFDKKTSFNIEKAFEKAKQATQKVQGAEQRKKILQQEITQAQDFSEAAYQAHLQGLARKQIQQAQRKTPEGQFRKLTIPGDTPVTVLMGKNAAENLKLLRQAKAWDIWVHLKDYPSAYAILQKNKDKSISDQVIVQAGQWLVKEALKSKKNMEGVKISVVVVECRHVRPIKGDKLGRVTYHHPRELLITV